MDIAKHLGADQEEVPPIKKFACTRRKKEKG